MLKALLAIISFTACAIMVIGTYYADFELIAGSAVVMWLVLEAMRFLNRTKVKPKQENPDVILRKIARKLVR